MSAEHSAEKDADGAELPDGPGGYDEYEPAAAERDAGREALVTIRPDPDLIGHIEGNKRIIAADKAAARQELSRLDALADYAATILEPWGPFEMGGFEGCTDQSPDLCACATDRRPTCENCGQDVEPGEQAWARRWPCYNTLPLGHPDQEWDVISWHDACPDTRVLPPAKCDNCGGPITTYTPDCCHVAGCHECVLPPGERP